MGSIWSASFTVAGTWSGCFPRDFSASPIPAQPYRAVSLDMSLSKSERLESIDRVLLAILTQVGDRSIATAWFSPSDPTFAGFPRTNWDDLSYKRLVKPAEDPRCYLLTGGGMADTGSRTPLTPGSSNAAFAAAASSGIGGRYSFGCPQRSTTICFEAKSPASEPLI